MSQSDRPAADSRPQGPELPPALPTFERLPNFLNAVRNDITGQMNIMDRNDRIRHTQFCAEIVEAYLPANRLEAQLAHSIAADYWRLNRIRGIEDGIFSVCHPNPSADFDEIPIHQMITHSQTHAFLWKQADFKFLSLYESRIQRTLNRNMKELKELQAERRQREADSIRQPEPAKTLVATAASSAGQWSGDVRAAGDGFGFSNRFPAPDPPPIELAPFEMTTSAKPANPPKWSGLIAATPEPQINPPGQSFGFFKTHSTTRPPLEIPVTSRGPVRANAFIPPR